LKSERRDRKPFLFYLSVESRQKNPQQFAAINSSEVLSRKRQLEFDCFSFIDFFLSDSFAVKINDNLNKPLNSTVAAVVAVAVVVVVADCANK